MAAKPFESRIQDLVYNVEVGVGLRLIKVGLYLLGVFIVLLLYTSTQFQGLRDAEAMDYSQLGRNLLVHNSLVTQTIRPSSMWYLAQGVGQGNPQLQAHPDLYHPPLYPAVLAGVFRVLGASFPDQMTGGVYPPEYIVIGIGHIFTLLSGLILYFIGLRLFERRVAFLAVTLFFLSHSVWGNAISGLNVSMVMFLALFTFHMALIAVVHRREEGASLKSWLIPFVFSILGCIAAFLTRYGAVVLLPGLLLMYGIGFGRKSWPLLAAVVLAFGLGISPWLARNQIVSGNPFGLALHSALNDSMAFEGDLFDRTLAVSFEEVEVGNALQRKWLENTSAFFDDGLPSMGDGILIGLFFATFFYRFVRLRTHLFRWAIALSGVLLLLVAGFFGESSMRLMEIFYPVVLLYATGFFFVLLDRLQLQIRLMNLGVILLFALLSALPLIFALLPPRVGVPYPPYYAPTIMQISGMLDPDEFLCTDMPWATAWYGKRDSLQLPATVDEFYDINDFQRRISGLYFTPVTRDQPFVRGLAMGPYRSWFPILQGRIPSDFPLREGIPINQMDQVFLTDRPRWNQ